MLSSLNFYKFILEFLEDCYFQAVTKAHTSILKAVLISCFEFLTYFCLDNKENQDIIKAHSHLIRDYLICYEVGQTQFFQALFLKNTNFNNNELIQEGVLVTYLHAIRSKQDSTC